MALLRASWILLARLSPAGQVLDLGQKEGGDVLAVDAGFVGGLERDLDYTFHFVEVEAVLLGNGVGDKHAAP